MTEKFKRRRVERGLAQIGKNLWEALWTVNGELIRRRFPTRKLAEAARDKARTGVTEGRYLDKKKEIKTPLEKAVAQFLEWGASNLSNATLLRDRGIAKTWLTFPRFKGKTLDQITVADIAYYKQERAVSGVCRNQTKSPVRRLSKRSVDIELTRLRRMFSIMKSFGLANHNPAAEVKKFGKDNISLRWLTEEEEVKLLSVVSPALGQRIRFAINTGMRAGEQFQLRWSDVDMKNKIAIITSERVKTATTRHVRLNSVALDILRTMPRPLQSSALVFGNENGNREVNYDRQWQAAVRASGISHCRWHDLRHSFGSRLAMAGVPILDIQKLMGHKNIAMTLRYAHLSPSKLQESVEVLCQNRQKTDKVTHAGHAGGAA